MTKSTLLRFRLIDGTTGLSLCPLEQLEALKTAITKLEKTAKENPDHMLFLEFESDGFDVGLVSQEVEQQIHATADQPITTSVIPLLHK